MDMLIKFVARFKAITDAYNGNNTDWEAIYKELSFLADDMTAASVSRNYPRKRELQHLWFLQYAEITAEIDRVIKQM